MTRCGWLMAVVLTSAAAGQTVRVPNHSFEVGRDKLDGWTLVGKGEWTDRGAAHGERCVVVTGSGTDSAYWRSGDLVLPGRTVYLLAFLARRLDAVGGGCTAGPAFCNRDVSAVARRWGSHESIFVTPKDAKPTYLRFGQWHAKGSVAYDRVELVRVLPVYRRRGDLILGAGETVAGDQYAFDAPLASASRNHSRPLAWHDCYFNTNRWSFSTGSEVVYRFGVGGRRLRSVTVDVDVTWYRSGEVVVEASSDGKTWKSIGAVGALGAKSSVVPSSLLPAREVWIRLRGQGKGGEKRCSLQVSQFSCRATLDGEGPDLIGWTRFVAVPTDDERLGVEIDGVGDALPGGRNVLSVRVTNVSDKAVQVRPSVSIAPKDAAGASGEGAAVAIEPGRTQLIEMPYVVPDAGEFVLRLGMGSGSGFRAEMPIRVNDLHRTSYGQRLDDGPMGLWWASSGWKVSRTRPRPKAKGEAITIRAARNEAEAAQLVVRPTADLRGLTVQCGKLIGPDGASLPAESVEVLRVGYVNVTRPTDATGTTGDWPDPLPPLAGPLDVPANTNLPLWVRVKVPRNTAPGVYRGFIHLRAADCAAAAPLHVEVYDFDLPDRMTCVTAFGLRPSTIWQYQKIKDPAQRRAVLDKYLANFSAHHVSPYDPAPLDPLKVTWPASDWTGGRRDRSVKHEGESSLRVADTSTTAQVSARFARRISIPDKGVRVSFWHKAARGHSFIVSLGHNRASGGWMSGRNNDIRVTGTGEWTRFEKDITSFPKGTASVNVTLWAALYSEEGTTTGTVWYDQVSLTDLAAGKELLTGGGMEPVNAAALRPTFDWTAWDAAMARAIDGYRFNSFRLRIPGMGGGSFHARYEPNLLGYTEDTPEYRTAFTNYCRAVQEHLREKGWLDEAFIYWFDEPAPKDYAFVSNGFRKLKGAAPDIARMLTEQVEPELIGGPNIWCPVSHHYDHESAEKRRAAGETFWWYVCTDPKAPYCTLFIDHPGTEMRAWLWQTWQRKIKGILVWQTNYWTSAAAYPDAGRPQNPYDDPMGWTSGYNTPKGVRRAWGNGDGRFVYPPEAAATGRQKETILDGPVDSMRWEMLRDGIEDYEYLVILRRLLKQRGAKLPAEQRKRFEALLEVPAEITSDMTTFTTDPAPIEKQRDAIARAIEALSK